MALKVLLVIPMVNFQTLLKINYIGKVIKNPNLNKTGLLAPDTDSTHSRPWFRFLFYVISLFGGGGVGGEGVMSNGNVIKVTLGIRFMVSLRMKILILHETKHSFLYFPDKIHIDIFFIWKKEYQECS